MANSNLLTQDSKNYLCCFYQILDDMIQGITGARLTQSVSHNFIVQMIPHHRAAVRMSENILRYAKNQAVRRLAGAIIEQQTAGINEMEEILPVCEQSLSAPMDLRLYQRRMDLIFREMFAAMNAAPESNRLAAVYLREMIPHHQGAVRMARNAQKYPVCVQLAPILQTIIAQQTREIAQMRSLLGRMGCGCPSCS